MKQDPKNFHVNDALNQINQAEYGAHYILIYPDLFTLRELYSNYIQKQIDENNEMILINPFYETTDSVRQILSKKGVDVSKYEKEKVLVIIDSLKVYFDQQQQQPNIRFIKSLAKYAKQMGKNCLSVLGDLGAYRHKSKFIDLMDYELSLPSKYDLDLKGFCLYHQKDFDKFSDEQKQKLIEHHGNTLEIERF
jgi:MEDS: MEthanogen/methylotroph, DcmR Sensory domain